MQLHMAGCACAPQHKQARSHCKMRGLGERMSACTMRGQGKAWQGGGGEDMVGADMFQVVIIMTWGLLPLINKVAQGSENAQGRTECLHVCCAWCLQARSTRQCPCANMCSCSCLHSKVLFEVEVSPSTLRC